MEVVHGVKDKGWLVKLLRGMISGPGEGDKQKKVQVVARRREKYRIRTTEENTLR